MSRGYSGRMYNLYRTDLIKKTQRHIMPTMGIKKKKQFQPKSTNDGVKEPHGTIPCV